MREFLIDILHEEALMSVGLSQKPSEENKQSYYYIKWNKMKVIMLGHTSEIGSLFLF